MNNIDYPILHLAGREVTPENKQLIVAIDHGFSFSNIEGLGQPFDIVRQLSAIKDVDGIIASFGIYKQAKRLRIDLSEKVRILTVDYIALDSFEGCDRLTQREIVLQPEEVESVQPHAYKMFLNIYDDTSLLIRNIRDFERFVTAGARNGVLALAEVMFYGNKAFDDLRTRSSELLRGCRLAMEAGADILKIPMVEDSDIIAEIADRLKLPIFLLGGAKCNSEKEMHNNLQRLATLPIYGVMFGRNIWQSNDISGMISKIAAAFHN
jgi:class I fructose-bisphosphate aldolase